MTLKEAIKHAVANMISDGLDDVLSTPIEIGFLRKDPQLRKELERISLKKIESYIKSPQSKIAFDQLSLLPISHVLVPKKEAFDFRKIAIIRPEDLAVYQAIAIMIAEPFEKTRRNVSRDRIFSYRFKPDIKKGQLFNPKYNLRSFQSASVRKSALSSVNYIVKCDIANFYDRVNIHRIESTLLTISGLDKEYVKLINQILLHWAKRDSYGLPVGSNGSRVLAEVALFNVDLSLKDAGIRFVRFVDDFRIFTKTATQAHSALAILIELLGREGLFINTRKSSIERLNVERPQKEIEHKEEVQAEKINIKEFRIFAGYGGTIPIKFRMPAKRSQKKYLDVNLVESINKICAEDFAQAEQIRDVLFAIIVQEKYKKLLTACDLVEMFPQFYPLLVDILIKNAEHIPQELRKNITKRFSNKLKNEDFLSEFMRASLVNLIGHPEFFDRDAIMYFIRSLPRNTGTYLGRMVFDVAQNLDERVDALEIREYFDRSNEWERRRIISLMSKVLPDQEYRAWLRAIRTYVSKDPFALAIK